VSMTQSEPTASLPQSMLVTGGKFKVDASGVWLHDGSRSEPELVSSPVYAEAATRDERSEDWGRLLRLTDPDGRNHNLTVPASLLCSESALVSILMSKGLVLHHKRAKELLIQHLQQPPLKRIRCCAQIGWYKDCFVLPDETFAPAGAEEVRFQTSMSSIFGALTTAGTLDGWRDSVGAWSVGNSRMLFCASMGFAGPLLEVANEQGGAAHLVGPTTEGKTTMERVCCSVMGAPQMMQSWRGTLNGLEGTAWAHNHLTLCLDEIAQVNAADAAEVAYLLSNGQGKVRADQTGAARPSARWLLLVLSTGEETLADHAATAGKHLRGGAEVRFVNIASDTGSGYKVFENLHGAPDGAAFSQMIKDAAGANYGHPLRHYIRWLVDNRVAVQPDLRGAIDSFVQDNAANAATEVKRAAKRFALIGAAGELATEAGVTGWPEGESMWAAKRCFESYLELRGTLGESDTEKAVNNVFAFIEKHGASRFQDTQAPRDQRVFNRAGFVRSTDHGDEYLFLPETFRSEVCKGADYTKVAHALAARGCLRRDAGRWTKKERLPGMGPKSVYVVLLRRDEPEEQLADAA
jgi:putative DNA primase/helicase